MSRVFRRVSSEGRAPSSACCFSYSATRLRIGQPFLDVAGGTHRRARTQEWREPCETKPGFIPKEDQIRLDRQAFFHDAAHVVDVAVKRAVREVHHLRAVQPTFRLQVQQCLLDRPKRDRAVHRVFRHGECLDVERLRAGQHHAVVVRLVAVAVDDGDVAGREQRLHRHLVRCGCAVGDEEHVIRTEGARGFLLGLLDSACGLEEAVEAAGRCAALREKKRRTVEFAHVANPVRPEDGFSASNRQRVKRADRPLRVLFQVVEERRFKSILHALQDRQVQLEQFLDRVKDATNRVGVRVAGYLLDRAIGHKVEVQLRPNPFQHLRQMQRRHF